MLFHHLLVEYTVDTLTDPHHAFVGFDVNVGSFHLHGIFEQRLQQPHHRRVAVALSTEARQVEIAVLQFAFQLTGQRGDFASASVELIEGAQQLAFTDYRWEYPFAQQTLHFVLGEEVERIGHADQQPLSLARQHDDAETPCHCLGQALGQLIVELVVFELDEGDLQLLGKRPKQASFIDETEIQYRAAELGAGPLLVLQCELQLSVTDQPGLDQEVAEANLALADVLSHCVPPREPARSVAN